MPWNSMYWDIVDQMYWTPRHLGLRSISQKLWQRHEGMVCVPEEYANRAGPLYSREGSIGGIMERLRGSEDVLNHLFDLTFAIAPDEVIRSLFLSPFGFVDAGSFTSLGREVRQRYGWGASENVTQQDGFFVSDNTALGVELKLRSASSTGQIAKYISLMTWEELRFGPKEQLGLLFVVPEDAMGGHWESCGLSGPAIDRGILGANDGYALPSSIGKLFLKHPEAVGSVVDRLRLRAVSWTSLRDRLLDIQLTLDRSQRGEQTLYRLLDGFLAQLRDHRDTGIPREPEESPALQQTA